MDFFNDAPPPAAADPTPALEPEPTAGEKRPREDGEGMPGEGMSFADMEQQRRDQAAAEAAQAAAAAAQAAAAEEEAQLRIDPAKGVRERRVSGESGGTVSGRAQGHMSGELR